MSKTEIQQILELTQENNAVLKRLLRAQLIQSWIRGAYIFIMIAFVYGGYVFLKPVLTNLLDVYQHAFSATGAQNDGSGTPIDIKKFNELLKSVQ